MVSLSIEGGVSPGLITVDFPAKNLLKIWACSWGSFTTFPINHFPTRPHPKWNEELICLCVNSVGGMDSVLIKTLIDSTI